MSNRMLLIAALVLLLVAGISFAQDGAAPSGTAETIACPEGIITNFSEIEGETIECGTVTVPVN